MPGNANANSSEQTATTPAGTSAVPTFGANAGVQDTGFRFTAGDGIEPWMIGKTAKEVAAITSQLYTELLRGGRAPAVQASYSPPQSAPTALQPPTPDEWSIDPASAAQKHAMWLEQTRFAPAMQQRDTSLGQISRAIIARDEADAFRRWGPEIDLLIQQVDPATRTVDNIKRVVDMVKGQHWQELVNDGLQAEITRRQNADPLRSGTAGGATPTGATASGGVDLSEVGLPPKYANLMRKVDMKPEVLDEFLLATECRRRGITLEQARAEWIEKAKKGDIILESAVRL